MSCYRTKDLIENCDSENGKSGRDAAAIEEIPHSFLQRILANEAQLVKKKVAQLPNLDKNIRNS